MVDPSVYCSMIHGGLMIVFKDSKPWAQFCCLRRDKVFLDIGRPFWPINELKHLKEKNLAGQWDNDCYNCQNLEGAGIHSFRQGMNDGLEIYGKTDLSGPARIDIMFDISCNLACRTCGTHSSTYWQKHLQSIGEWHAPIFTPRSKQEVLSTLATIDLTNLRQVVFCGGETLLGQEYWDVARWLTSAVPDSKNNLTICFQTNGTQTISPRNFDIIEACKLVKLHVSIDGIEQRFEYLRWPAKWHEVSNNVMQLRNDLPSNVMFLVEQTISIFNALSIDHVDQWVAQNLNQDSRYDHVDCTTHMAHGIFSLRHSSQELVDKLKALSLGDLISSDWIENSDSIDMMLSEIKKFDQHRAQSLEDTFPEVFECFRRFW